MRIRRKSAVFTVLRLVLIMCIAGIGVFAAQAPAQAVSVCGINAGEQRGYHICEYPETPITWPDGHRQIFVVGSDWQVYESHQRWPDDDVWTPWYPLNGQARSRVWVTNLGPAAITINVIGTDLQAHAKDWNQLSGWSNWRPTGTPPHQRVVAGDQEGWYISPYDVLDVEWPDGRQQKFIVGTTWHVYESHQRWAGGPWTPWASLNGTAQSHVWYVWHGDYGIQIFVYGTDEHVWGQVWDLSGGGRGWVQY